MYLSSRSRSRLIGISPCCAHGADCAVSTRKISTFVSRHFLNARSFTPISNQLAWLLIEVQPAADLDHPAVVQPDLAVVQVGIQFDVQDYVQIKEALLQFAELVLDLGHGRHLVVAGDEVDAFHGPVLDHRLAEPDEVLDLVRQADVRLLDDDLPRAPQIRSEDGLVAVARVAVEDREVLFPQSGLNDRLRQRRLVREVRPLATVLRQRELEWSSCSGEDTAAAAFVFIASRPARRLLCRQRILGLRAVDHHFVALGREVRQVDERELVVGLALVHLLLDPPAALHRIGHVLLELRIAGWPVRVENLQEGADRLLDALFVAAFDRRAQADAPVDLLVPVRVRELMVERLGQVVGDETVVAGQVLAAVLEHLPARQVAGEAVHDRQVELLRQGQEQVVLGRVDELLDGVIDVADEGQAGVGDHLDPAREAPVGHEVLHDLHGVGVFDVDPAHLVEGDGVPEADQADALAGVVIEEGGLRRLAAADQRGVGGELAEEVGLPRAARPQLDEVEVGFGQRHTRPCLMREAFSSFNASHVIEPIVPGIKRKR